MPNPYAIIGATALSLALIIGAFFYGKRVDDLVWTVKWETFKVSAEKEKTDALAKARATEAANADLSAQLEETRHAATLAAADKDAAVRAALASARMLAQRLCARPNSVPGVKATGGASDIAAGSDGGLSAALDDDHANCAKSANVLAGYVRECQAFAVSMQHR